MTDIPSNSIEDIILKTAKDLFWKYGIKKVSVEEISKKAGLSKMTFYRNFKNKNEVVKVVLKNLTIEGQQDYQKIMQQEIVFPEKITQLIQLKLEYTKQMSNEFISDIYLPKFSELREILYQHQKKQIKVIKKDFRKAQREGWIRKEFNIDFIMYMMADIQNKMEDEQLQKLYKNKGKLIMDMINFFFYGILNQKDD